MSENDYLKEIPLSEVAVDAPDAFVDGPFGSNLKSAEYTDDGVRLIQLQNIGVGQWLDFSKKFVSKRKLATLARHAVRAGDIAIAKMAEPVARACVVPPVADDFLVVADCIKLRVNEAKADPRFVVDLLNSHDFRTQAERKSIGTTRIRINLSVLKSLEIAVPGLAVQRRIAEILDTADEAIQSTERLIAKLEQAKQGLLHDILARGIDKGGCLRDPARLTGSPVEARTPQWQSVRLRDIADVTSGSTPSRAIDWFWKDGTVPWVKTAEINFSRIYNTTEKITRTSLNNTGMRIYPVDTVLVAMYGEGVTRGRVAILGVPAATNQACAAISGNRSRLSQRFLYNYLRANYDRLRALGHGSQQTNLSGALLGEFLISLPSMAEQERISDLLDHLDKRSGLEEMTLDKLRLLKQGLMDDLLTGRVRVGASA